VPEEGRTVGGEEWQEKVINRVYLKLDNNIKQWKMY
jgi:hypothetical protein